MLYFCLANGPGHVNTASVVLLDYGISKYLPGHWGRLSFFSHIGNYMFYELVRHQGSPANCQSYAPQLGNVAVITRQRGDTKGFEISANLFFYKYRL